MSEEKKSCSAVTKAGTPCKNAALAGSDYCFVHRKLAEAAATAPVAPGVQPDGRSPAVSKPAPPAFTQASLNMLISELNMLTQELQQLLPSYTPPPITPAGLQELLQTGVGKVVPAEQIELVNQLRRNLQEASVRDLVDPDTWRGLWYVLNALAQAQSASVRESLANRISSLPGMQMMIQLKGNLEGTTPKDLVDIETWKGLAYIISYTAQLQAQEARRRILGASEDDT